MRDERRGLAQGGRAADCDRRRVVSVSGSGGFAQYAMALATATRHGMEVTNVLVDNDELGKISKEQCAAYFDVWQTPLQTLDVGVFAGLWGARGFAVHEPGELDGVLAEARTADGPARSHVRNDGRLV